MNLRSEPTFDPYGELFEAGQPSMAAPKSNRAQNAAVAVFWSIALLLVAGRMYLSEQQVEQVSAPPEKQASLLLTPTR